MSERTLAMGIADWFGDAGHAALAACVVSILALVVSVLAWVTSWRTQKRQVEIEEAREQDRVLQARKAILVARIVREQRAESRTTLEFGRRDTHSSTTYSTYFHLEIENKGMAPARDISVALDGGPLCDHPSYVPEQPEVRLVGPQSAFRYELAPSFAARLPSAISIRWSDDSGEPGKYETTLT